MTEEEAKIRELVKNTPRGHWTMNDTIYFLIDQVDDLRVELGKAHVEVLERRRHMSGENARMLVLAVFVFTVAWWLAVKL